MHNAEAFWDRIAPKYAKKPVKNVNAYQQTMERSRLYLSSSDEVLELGCGTGSTALLLADSVRHITASDISSKMIGIAKSKAGQERVDNVTFVQATPFDDRFEPGSFDVILAYNFLHLLNDVPAAVRRVADLLRPNGVFISKTVCLGDKGLPLRLFVRGLQALRVAPYVNFLKSRTLEAAMEQAGFRIVETGDYPASPPNHFVVARIG